MTFIEAIQSGFKNYSTFTGRAPRSEYNYWILFVILLSIVVAILDPPDYYGAPSASQNILTIVLLLPNLSVMIRRFHDINKSGWNYWWVLTIIGLFPVLYWQVFKPGDKGHNSYGPDPLNPFEQSNSPHHAEENKANVQEDNSNVDRDKSGSGYKKGDLYNN